MDCACVCFTYVVFGLGVLKLALQCTKINDFVGKNPLVFQTNKNSSTRKSMEVI